MNITAQEQKALVTVLNIIEMNDGLGLEGRDPELIRAFISLLNRLDGGARDPNDYMEDYMED